MGLFSFLGLFDKTKDALRRGAIIIDVRTPQEFDMGHIPEAMHIPVDRIRMQSERLKAMKRPIVLCCNSGARSGKALVFLKAEGLKDVYNGGNWQHLLKIMHRL
ncbi:MAG: rhodanese-like domain-containing protein [Sphingobacteriales bacterium]|nr:rhodanese-like domain-containing protein [Sphingobacteriales bacterium]